MKQSYDFRPKPVEHIVSTGIVTTVIRYNITARKDGIYECEETEYNHRGPLSSDDYGPMVSAVIRSRYSQDQVEAITQNYLADPSSHEQEFLSLQDWRNEAKRIVKDIDL